MVVSARPARAAAGPADIDRLIAGFERQNGPLRIAVGRGEDGLAIHIPPRRQALPLLFMSAWFVGVVYAGYHARGMLAASGATSGTLIWMVLWLGIAAFALWVVAWQAFGEERLFVTAHALTRERSLAGYRRRRVLPAADIRTVTTDRKARGDPAGLGTVKLTTSGRAVWVGGGLSAQEAVFVADLVRAALGRAAA